MGWRGETENPPITRSDWAVKDETGAIYVTGLQANNLNSIKDVGYPLKVLGILRVNTTGIPYIQAKKVMIREKK